MSNNMQVRKDRLMAKMSGNPEHCWYVYCNLCRAGGGDSPLALFQMFRNPLGYAGSWTQAIAYADQHAREHEATRCTTCLHVPAAPVASTPKKAATA